MVVVTGLVENRLIELPQGFTPAALTEAANYLNARLSGRTLTEAHASVSAELEAHTAQLDALATKVVEAGIATWSGDGDESMLILRGRDKMFEDVNAVADLERIRALFESLERKNSLLRLIDSTQGGEGVHVFIGAESRLFDLAGCSMIVAPLAGANRDDGAAKPVGAIGVIGPTRINYARIIPMVDYTARAVSRLMG
jgi:heat-inducible transcriptional repressor